VRGTGVAGTVFIGVSAFWLSYRSLTRLAEMSGIHDPWLWPLIVDGVIVVATVAAVAMAGRRGAWYPWLLLVCGAVVSVTANAIQAWLADVEVPHPMAAAVASIPPVVLLAITHLTVVLSRPDGQPEARTPPAAAPATTIPERPRTPAPPISAAAAPLVPASRLVRPPSHHPPRPAVVRPAAPAPAVVAVSAPVAEPPGSPSPATGTVPAPTPEPATRPAPEDDEQTGPQAPTVSGRPAPGVDVAGMSDEALNALLADLRREADTQDAPAGGQAGEAPRTVLMERAARLKTDGLTNKQIGQRLGVNPTTIGRWLRRLANGDTDA
jgi:hypothetical protein